MLVKLIVITLILSPFSNGVLFLLASKDREKYEKVAKFKDGNDEDYKYNNLMASKAYMAIGGILGLFLLILNVCYDFFATANPIMVVGVHYLIIFLIEQVLIDVIVNVKIQTKDL